MPAKVRDRYMSHDEQLCLAYVWTGIQEAGPKAATTKNKKEALTQDGPPKKAGPTTPYKQIQKLERFEWLPWCRKES